MSSIRIKDARCISAVFYIEEGRQFENLSFFIDELTHLCIFTLAHGRLATYLNHPISTRTRVQKDACTITL